MASVPLPGHCAPCTQETIYVCCPDVLFVDRVDLSRVVEISFALNSLQYIHVVICIVPYMKPIEWGGDIEAVPRAKSMC